MQPSKPASKSKDKCCRKALFQSCSRNPISARWSGRGQAYIPLSVPGTPSLSAGSVGAGASRAAGAPSARQHGGTAAQPSPALCDSRHLPEPYLTAWHGAGHPGVPPHGAQWPAAVGSSCPAGGKKKVIPAAMSSCVSFGGFLHFGTRFFATSEEENLSQGGHQPDPLHLHQTSTSGSVAGGGCCNRSGRARSQD